MAGVFRGKTYYTMNPVKEHPKSIQVTKFNSDIEMESSYTMNFIDTPDGGYYDCQCPASKFDCRHKSILKMFKAADKIGSGQFFCFETKTFHNMESI